MSDITGKSMIAVHEACADCGGSGNKRAGDALIACWPCKGKGSSARLVPLGELSEALDGLSAGRHEDGGRSAAAAQWAGE